jgi:hypothetical protein
LKGKAKLRFFGAYDALKTVGRVTALVDKFFMENFDTYVDYPKTLKPFFEHWNGVSNPPTGERPYIELEWLGIGLKVKILFGAKQTGFDASWATNSFVPNKDKAMFAKHLRNIFLTIGKENKGK